NPNRANTAPSIAPRPTIPFAGSRARRWSPARRPISIISSTPASQLAAKSAKDSPEHSLDLWSTLLRLRRPLRTSGSRDVGRPPEGGSGGRSFRTARREGHCGLLAGAFGGLLRL